MAKRSAQKRGNNKHQVNKIDDESISTNTSVVNKTEQTGPVITKADKIQIMLYIKPNAKQSAISGLTADRRLGLQESIIFHIINDTRIQLLTLSIDCRSCTQQ
jgi:hypothetical protein